MHFLQELYTFEEFVLKFFKEDPFYIKGYRVFFELYNGKTLISQNEKEIVFVLYDDKTLYLEYIGIKEDHRGGVLKKLHKNCVDVLKRNDINKILLKPLTDVLTMWIYFGFMFERVDEEIRAKFTMINFLKDKNIISKDDILHYDAMDIQEIVKKHKDIFKSDDFPIVVEKELYYTNLKKVL